MDFDLPDTAIAVRDGVAAVAAKYDHDYWSRCEEEKRYPTEVYTDLAEGGWLGLSVPEEYGGGGQGLLETAIACETLCASGGTAGVLLLRAQPGLRRDHPGPPRHRGAEAGDPARPRERRDPVLLRPDRAGRRLQRDRDQHQRPQGRRRLPDQGPEGLDLQRRARRLDGRGRPAPSRPPRPSRAPPASRCSSSTSRRRSRPAR